MRLGNIGPRPSSEKSAEIKAWARAAFGAPEEATITLNELRCHEAGCPPVETIVAWLRPGEEPLKVTIPKPVDEVREADLVDALGAERRRVLGDAWTDAAEGYERYFVPRFAPWLERATDALLEADLPEGPIALPCCGTAPELPRLARALPERDAIGVDLSAGMMDRAAERGHPRARFVVGDAGSPDDAWGHPAGLLSCFGLQQIPNADRAAGAWIRALVPGGLMSVIFWPFDIEEEGPFAWLRAAMLARLPTPDLQWEDRLVGAIEQAGGLVERDESVAFPMKHESPETFFDAVLHAGPLRAAAHGRDEAWIEDLREGFLRLASPGPAEHTPRARWIVATREPGRTERVAVEGRSPR